MECEFAVDRFCAPTMLAGRITRGDLTVGALFSLLIERTAHRTIDANGELRIDCEDIAIRRVDLKVVALEAYDRPFQTLGAGMVAGVSVAGESIDDVAAALGSAAFPTYFVLRGQNA